ncbi:MAG: ferritin-like domain-containing protein [Candidatus Levybacteria bacterium]|nr:ferritin-like domain-containing protein [Candidatus Levybacteria bacterium]
MKLTTLHDLFVHEIQDLYDAEHQITQAMPQIMEAISSEELKTSFEHHLHETKEQIRQLETVCGKLGIDPQGKTCIGIEGVIEEGVEMLQENTPSPALDAAIIANAQRIEHYEIAGYGCAVTYAKLLGYTDAVSVLKEILNEEETTDKLLSKIAETKINPQALAPEGKYAM